MDISAPHTPVTFIAAEARTIADMFARRVARHPERAAFFTKPSGRWTPTTWKDWSARSARVAGGLVRMGLEVGDRVAILGPTQAPWAYYDIGAQMAGCVSLGIYPKQSVDQVRYILQHSEAKVVFVADAVELDAVLEAAEGSALQAIVPWTAELLEGREHPLLRSPADFEGEALSAEDQAAREQSLSPEDTAIFVYTSGTTGPPKCAMITHANILTVLGSQTEVSEFWEDDISLSFLPMAHVAERILAFYGRINTGFATAYATSIASVLEELGEVRPTIFGSVPRIFEKAYGKIQSELERKPPAVRKLFGWADRVGRARVRAQLAGRRVPLGIGLQFAIADAIVFKKVRAAFGGRVRSFLTGAAPIPLEILEFFWAAGLPIYECYGQTEATVVTHANRVGATRLGTVGKLLPGIEQRIAEDGEVLIRGPYVFKGYFKDPEATAKTVVDDWLHTGDIGSLDSEGYLRITDRKKHIIITAGGKNLTPANIENAIKACDPLISHVHAYADKRPFVSALIAPSPLETLEFGKDRGLVTQAEIDARTKELMANPAGRTEALAVATAPVTSHPDYIARMKAAVRKGNESLSQVEKVKRFVVLDRDFSQEAGELTPTMKVRRKNVEAQHGERFERIYGEEGYAHEP